MNTILIHLKRNKNQVKDVANKYLLKLALQGHCKAFNGKKMFQSLNSSYLKILSKPYHKNNSNTKYLQIPVKKKPYSE